MPQSRSPAVLCLERAERVLQLLHQPQRTDATRENKKPRNGLRRCGANIHGTAKATVLKLLVEIGEFCSTYQDFALRGLCSRLEVDEIWAFCGAKARNAKQPGQGDIWTFTCLDPDSKLMISWMVGSRDTETASMFLRDVADRMSRRVQLSTDGHGMHRIAVCAAFGHPVDWAQAFALKLPLPPRLQNTVFHTYNAWRL